MNLKQQMLSYGGVNIINASVPFLLLPILTSYLSPEDYGILSLVQLLMMLSLPVVLLNSQGLLTMEYSNLSPQKYKLLVSTAVITPVLGFFVLEVLFFVFSSFILKYFQLSPKLLFAVPFFLLVQVIPIILPIIFQAKKEPFNYGKFKISLTLVNVFLTLLFVVYFGYNWEGRLWGIIGSFIIFSIVGYIILLQLNYLSLKFDSISFKQIINFGIPLIPHTIAGVLLASSSKFFLSSMINNEAVGIYTVALQVASSVLIVMVSINQAWAPNLYERLNKKPQNKEKKLIVSQTYKIMLIMIAVTLIFIVLVPFVYQFLIDKRYTRGVLLSRLISIGFLFNGLYFLFTNYILFSKKTKVLSSITVSISVIGGIINYFLILKYGIKGASLGVIITFFLLFTMVVFYANKLYPMPWLKNMNKSYHEESN